ncbi:TadE/TadG family type IV pilus assembly protein [Rhizorhabdus argentea]|uniref:TadE/TadG family type IV pilus assembly protein n=1 Tax=Rhizorhabdus argentea TaxID=1387174 RepID=UPI0030EBE21C
MIRIVQVLRRLRHNRSGATIVETALVLPAFLMLIIGGIYLALLGFTVAGMHYAVEAGARCSALGLSACSDDTKTAAYTRTQFMGASTPAPTFTASTAACGHVVTGSLTFVMSTGVQAINVPLTSTACFP